MDGYYNNISNDKRVYLKQLKILTIWCWIDEILGSGAFSCLFFYSPWFSGLKTLHVQATRGVAPLFPIW